jgi:hypothetical protein
VVRLSAVVWREGTLARPTRTNGASLPNGDLHLSGEKALVRSCVNILQIVAYERHRQGSKEITLIGV